MQIPSIDGPVRFASGTSGAVPRNVEEEQWRSDVQSRKILLLGLGVSFSLISLIPSVPERPNFTFACLATISWGHLAFNVWLDQPDIAEARRRSSYSEYLSMASTAAACVLCNQCDLVFLRALSVLVIPVSITREVKNSPMRYHLYMLVHFLLTLHASICSMWDAGWQWLAVLLIEDAMLIDMASMLDVAREGHRIFSKLLGSMCDAYIIITQEGCIVGADEKAVDIFHINPMLDAHVSDLQHSSEPSETLLACAEFRKQMLCGRGGSCFNAEVYTIPWSLPQRAVKMISRGWQMRNTDRPVFLRSFRIMETLISNVPPAHDGLMDDDGCAAPSHKHQGHSDGQLARMAASPSQVRALTCNVHTDPGCHWSLPGISESEVEHHALDAFDARTWPPSVVGTRFATKKQWPRQFDLHGSSSQRAREASCTANPNNEDLNPSVGSGSPGANLLNEVQQDAQTILLPPIVAHLQELQRHFAVDTEERARDVLATACEMLMNTRLRRQWNPCSAWMCPLCNSTNDEEDVFCMCCLCDRVTEQDESASSRS